MPRNPKLKLPYTEMEYTAEQIAEIKKCKEDPVYFCKNYVYIQHPSRGQILFKLYDYQEEIIRNYQEHKYNILLSARQTGKTETTAAYLLWYALFHKRKNILIASNKSDNAMMIIERIQNAYEELPHWLKFGIDADNWNKHRCSFENGSTILSQATTEKTGRGFSISLLYCLGGENTVKIRHKETLVEEEITLEELFIRLNPEFDLVVKTD